MKKGMTGAFLACFFLGLWTAAAVAWGTEGNFPPQWEEEPPASLAFPEEAPAPPPEENGWQDWEEDWNGSWNGAASQSPGEEPPGWEPWEEEDQDRMPDWGPALVDPEEEPAFPEELPPEPSASSKPPASKAPKPPASKSEKAAKPKAPSKSQGDTVTFGEDGTPGADFPGLLPHRVTQEDLPQGGTPLWHRAADPNILWVLLVAVSLVVLGLRLLWGEDQGRRSREDRDDREPVQEKWEV